jgi:dihydrofolate synthase/folylpolyglutamate synthase
VLTAISFDHTEYLGDTLEKIASEKCGIIKENIPVVLYPLQDNCVFKTVEKFCTEKKSELIIPKKPEIKNSKMLSEPRCYYKMRIWSRESM